MYGNSKAKTHEKYIAEVGESRREDVQRLHDLIREVAPGLEPTMEFGIANDKQYISLYCCSADERGYVAERYRERLPKANIGKSCVRFKRLSDLDDATLRELIRETADGEYGV